MEKINIAKLLKDCPKGTKLYSLIHGEVELTRVGVECIYFKPNYLNYELSVNLDGRWIENMGECILFPSKENRDWTKFQRPFKDGDIIYTHCESNVVFISIFKEIRGKKLLTYCDLGCIFHTHESNICCDITSIKEQRLATEEEKQKLFDAIKANGYKWNAKTKTLEKLIKPKFKVGDRIKHKKYTKWVCTIRRVTDRYYVDGHPTSFTLLFDNQDAYELVPNKFDITTLKPFDKVLVRDSNEYCWHATFYSHHTGTYFYSTDGLYAQCVPYEDNKHLLGTKDDCADYFKTWK